MKKINDVIESVDKDVAYIIAVVNCNDGENIVKCGGTLSNKITLLGLVMAEMLGVDRTCIGEVKKLRDVMLAAKKMIDDNSKQSNNEGR